jgi:hypothetical protein
MSEMAENDTCDRVQVHLVAGDLPRELEAHVRGCEECGFVAALSRDARGSRSSSTGGDPLVDLLAAASERGDALAGRYRLESLIGRGGQGLVYRACDVESGDEVAVKVVRLSAHDPYRSAREVGFGRRIRHPHVCAIHHTERHGALRLIVMELADGGTLEDLVGKVGRDRAIELFDQVCAGVEAAHAEGVLHLDIKPRNVLIRRGRALVADFGLASELDSREAAGGTPAFMAPEQAAGEPVDVRADVYALGVLLRTLVARLSISLSRVVRRATATSPSDRFPDVASLRRAVRSGRRTRTLALGLGLGAVVAGVVWASVPGGDQAAPASSRVWFEDMWGLDTLPPQAVNVALARNGSSLPRAVASHPPWACGRHLDELLDGITQYTTWEHGYAFPPAPSGPPGLCVSLELLRPDGRCGQRDPAARLCDQRGEDDFVVLAQSVGDADALAGRETMRLGQLVSDLEQPCGERWIQVDLDGVHPVFAVRTWHHEPVDVARAYRIDVDVEGAWSTVYSTSENHMAILPQHYVVDAGGRSAPVTAEFPAVSTDSVRFVMDTCTTPWPECADFPTGSECRPGHGWLYEVEVFALPGEDVGPGEG